MNVSRRIVSNYELLAYEGLEMAMSLNRQNDIKDY